MRKVGPAVSKVAVEPAGAAAPQEDHPVVDLPRIGRGPVTEGLFASFGVLALVGTLIHEEARRRRAMTWISSGTTATKPPSR